MTPNRTRQFWVYPGIRASVWVIYAIASYIISSYAAGVIVLIAQQLDVAWDPTTTAGSLVLRCLVYGLLIACLIGGLKLARVSNTQLTKLIGLARSLEWRDLGLSVVGFLAYGLLTVIVLTVATHVPGFESGQVQDVGVNGMYGTERLIAFLVLVIVAPIAEEIAFRGVLYGYIRKLGIARWAAVLAVSILFGLAHGQWNVGLDVFCLSVVLCTLRELTGSIWAGIVVHMIKNGIAFCLLFLVA